MANYYATTRTNYFSVTDPQRLIQLVKQMSAEDEVELFDDGNGKYGFGCYGCIGGLGNVPDDECDDEPDYDLMCEELQKIVAEGDAIIIMEAGHEKLRYVVGTGTVITKDAIMVVSLSDCLLGKAREMLGNPTFNSAMDY